MEILDELEIVLLLPFKIFQLYPLLILLPAGIFFIIFLFSKKKFLLMISAAWLAYGGWEWHMQGWTDSVIAPSRTDLFVIVPLLYFLSAVGLYQSTK